MDIHYIPTVFFILFFVVDPPGLIPVFPVYISGFPRNRRRPIIIRSTGISVAVSIFFLLLGRYLPAFLGISAGSFLVAGGIPLFLIAIAVQFIRNGLVHLGIVS